MLRESLRQGRMKPTTLAREESREDWKPIAELLGGRAPAVADFAPAVPRLDPYLPPVDEPDQRLDPASLARKPVGLWFVQALLLIAAGGFAWGATRLPLTLGSGAFLLAGCALGLGVVVGLSLRSAWARWTGLVLMLLLTVSSAVQNLARPASSNPVEGGRLAGNVVGLGLLLVAVWFGLLGESARAYFSSVPSPASRPALPRRRRKRKRGPK